MGRGAGTKQANVSGIRRRSKGPSADDILFGQMTPVRPVGAARSFRHEGKFNGFPCEYWTSSEEEISAEEAFDRDLLHREDGPAFIAYVEVNSPTVEREVWYRNGRLHREDGPSVTQFFSNGMPMREEWFLDGDKHREGGPAEVTYDEIAASEGQQVIEDEVWWTHGQMDDLAAA